MDPDALLNDLLDRAARLMDDPGEESPEATWIAQQILALDEWITREGFMPARWRK